MRKLFVFIAALITLGFLAGVVWAGQVSHQRDAYKSRDQGHLR